jgi:GWxTD domain-containing protein
LNRFFLILCLLFAGASRADDPSRPVFDESVGEPVFSLDGATFWDPAAASPSYEVYVRIPGSSLRFQRTDSDGGMIARYEIAVVIGDKHNPQIYGRSIVDSVFVPRRIAADDTSTAVVQLIRFPLAPGEYDLRVTVSDLSGGLSFDKQRRIEVRDISGPGISFSDLAFSREIFRGADSTRFTRGDITVYPSVTRHFGIMPSRMSVFYEVYAPKAFVGDTAYVAYEARGDRRTTTFRDTAVVYLSSTVVPVVFLLQADELVPGEYDLKLRWSLASTGGWRESHKEPFVVDWSVLGVVRADWKSAVDQLRYVANNEELDRLRDAPESARLSAFVAFWDSRDPEPDLPGNPLRDEYYRRVRFAEANFSVFTDGWRTDMGRVYIVNGPPDEIDRHPFSLETKPYEVWYYYRLRKRYVFMDVNGYGEYELLYEPFPY